jgi:hypothetical protein
MRSIRRSLEGRGAGRLPNGGCLARNLQMHISLFHPSIRPE